VSERCPLGNGLRWINEYVVDSDGKLVPDVPDVCMRQCGELIEQAIQGRPIIDMYDKEFQHGVDHGGHNLQRLSFQKRGTAILSVCSIDGRDVFAEEYTFDCPYN